MAKVGITIQITIQVMFAQFNVKPRKKKEPIKIPVKMRNEI